MVALMWLFVALIGVSMRIVEAGEVIAGLEIGELLGAGAYSVVHRATDADGSQVVVKIVNDVVYNKEETDVMAALHGQPNIIQLIDVRHCDKHNQTLIVMEYIENASSIDSYDELHEEIVCAIILRLLIALNAMHSKGFVHLDVKPSNILFAPDAPAASQVKLTDFGFAHPVPDQAEMTAHNMMTVCGTRGYLAPEIMLNDKLPLAMRHAYDRNVDIWSLGISAIEIRSGKSYTKDHYSLVSLFSLFSLDGRDFIKKCLMKDPKRRPSASVLLHHKWFKRHH